MQAVVPSHCLAYLHYNNILVLFAITSVSINCVNAAYAILFIYRGSLAIVNNVHAHASHAPHTHTPSDDIFTSFTYSKQFSRFQLFSHASLFADLRPVNTYAVVFNATAASANDRGVNK